MKRVLSGIQPTGLLHIGNYLGAISHWQILQNTHECYYSIVDLHAITSQYFNTSLGTQIAEQLRNNSMLTAATLISCGIQPQNIFIQSQIPEILQLTWIFQCISPLSWFNKMTQFKEKKDSLKGSSLGLLSYPALMAADILVLKANEVPVGNDQQQHVELARDVALRFNSLFQDIFPLPEYKYTKFPRVMSLRNAQEKMSKSSRTENSRVNLMDNSFLIEQKIMKAKTDSLGKITNELEHRLEVQNLLNIYSNLVQQDVEVILESIDDVYYLKQALIGQLKNLIYPIREQTVNLLKDQKQLEKLLSIGRDRARSVASQTLKEAKELVGFLNF